MQNSGTSDKVNTKNSYTQEKLYETLFILYPATSRNACAAPIFESAKKYGGIFLSCFVFILVGGCTHVFHRGPFATSIPLDDSFYYSPFARRFHVTFFFLVHSYFSFAGTITIRMDYDLGLASVCTWDGSHSHTYTYFRSKGNIQYCRPHNLRTDPRKRVNWPKIHVIYFVCSRKQEIETWSIQSFMSHALANDKVSFKSDTIFRHALIFDAGAYFFSVSLPFSLSLFLYMFICGLTFAKFKFRNWHRNEIFFSPTIFHSIFFLLTSAAQMCM